MIRGLELRERIGQGGMGSVFRAYDPSLDRYVAVKYMEEALSQDATCVERFLREARNLARIDHPNVVRVISAGKDDSGRPYFVMEFVDGDPLSSLIQRGPAPERTTVEIAQQLLSALDVVHRHGITHRDIKPTNILISRDNKVKLIDFGIAKDAELSSLTISSRPLGTPRYMSPEQALGNPITTRTDIYSVGLVLYELLAGRPAMMADDPLTLIRMHIDQPPSQLPSHISPQLQEAVMRALSKRPEDRFCSAGEMLQALHAPGPGHRQDSFGNTTLSNRAVQVSTSQRKIVGMTSLAILAAIAVPVTMHIYRAGQEPRVWPPASTGDKGDASANVKSPPTTSSSTGAVSETQTPKPKPNPPPVVTAEKARDLVSAWVLAQNEKDFESYRLLYHPNFQGIKRTRSGRIYTYSHSTWMADRRKMFRNTTNLTVSVSDVFVEEVNGTAIVKFTQYFSAKEYADYGPKFLKLVSLNGRTVIVKEELLWSKTL